MSWVFHKIGLFSCPQQLNRWPCPLLGWLVGWAPLTIREFTTLQSDPRDLWPLRHLIRLVDDNLLWQFFMTILMTIFDDNFRWQFLWQFLMTILMTIFWTYFQFVTCDIWDTDYNTDNWESGFMTIFVNWQLIVTLDSIRNSCDVS